MWTTGDERHAGDHLKSDGTAAGDGGDRGTAHTTYERVRRGGEPFLASFVALRDAVCAAYAGEAEPEAGVAAAIKAALRFAAEEPARAHALAVQARRQPSGDSDLGEEIVAEFAALLGRALPYEEQRRPPPEEAIIESMVITVRAHLLEDTPELLPALAPEFVYLALVPYAGVDGARRLAEDGGDNGAGRS